MLTHEKRKGPVANGVEGTGALICLLHQRKVKHPIVAMKFHLGKFDGKKSVSYLLDNLEQYNSGNQTSKLWSQWSQNMSLGSIHLLRYYKILVMVIIIVYALDIISIITIL